MSGYRDAAEVLQHEGSMLRESAHQVCKDLGIEGESYEAHALLLLTALRLYHDRNQQVHDAWRHVGALGNLLTLWGKVMRLMNSLWWKRNESERTEKPVDNAIDAVNYAVFFARSYLAGDMNGSPGSVNKP